MIRAGNLWKRLAALLLLIPLLVILGITLFGWNWARAPLQHLTLEKTGRQLLIAGDLSVSLGWPATRLTARSVSFANPPWAKERQMVAVDQVELSVDLTELLRMNLVFPEVRLTRPTVFLEKAADGRKTWLLDQYQSNESARIPIGRLTLDRGLLGYDDAGGNTSIRAEISTQESATGSTQNTALVFSASGIFRGVVLAAHGSGGPVLALHDESLPYPLKVDATLGRTGVQADGSITGLVDLTAMDIQLRLHGDSLALLYPLLGIAFPETHAYVASGHLVHGGKIWRYDEFSGRMGNSDIAGSLQLDVGASRPFISGELVSRKLNFADLGPLIGANDRLPASGSGAGAHLLPATAFKTGRWNSVDADVSLHAKTMIRKSQLPLDDLHARLRLRDSRLNLDPLDFGVAGGHLKAAVVLDGGHDPIQAVARIDVRRILLARLFPAVNLAGTSIGQIDGEINLTGTGNSVGRMLATADGRIRLVVAHGAVSKLLMEKISLHLVEMLQLKLMGDKTVKLRCALADFGVKNGVMKANTLVLDTEVSTISGVGRVDLGREEFDLTFVPKTRNTSPVALRTPIHIGGTFVHPEVGLDKARIAARGVGALALGLLNPLLVLVPLVEMGPGIESECGRLVDAAHVR